MMALLATVWGLRLPMRHLALSLTKQTISAYMYVYNVLKYSYNCIGIKCIISYSFSITKSSNYP